MNPYNTADSLQRLAEPEQVQFKAPDPEEVAQIAAAIKRHRDRQNDQDRAKEAKR